MKKIIILLTLITLSLTGKSQEQFPGFTNDALVTPDSINISMNGEYHLLVYGAIGCSYSRYLVDNLKVFDGCEQLEIIILLRDDADSILKEYPELITKYNVYSNHILGHEFKKHNDITPQTFLFKAGKQLLHIKGVKKKMFVKINDMVSCK